MHRSVDFVRAHPFGCAVFALIAINLIPATYAFRPWQVWQSWQLLEEWLRWVTLVVVVSFTLVGAVWLLVRWITAVDRWASAVHKQHQLLQLELVRASRWQPGSLTDPLAITASAPPELPQPPLRRMVRLRPDRPTNRQTKQSHERSVVSLLKPSDSRVSLHKQSDASPLVQQKPPEVASDLSAHTCAAPPPIRWQVDVSAQVNAASSALAAVEEVFARHDITSSLTPPPMDPILIPAGLVSTWRNLATRSSLTATHLPPTSFPGGERS